MNRYPMIALALLCAGCGESTPASAPALAPSGPSAPVEPPTAAPPTDAPEQAVLAVQQAPAPEAEAPPRPAGENLDPVTRFTRALSDVKDCARAEDGFLVEDPATCFAEVKAVRELLIHPPAAPLPGAGPSLRDQMAAALEGLLSHEEPTVVYYVLTGHAVYLRASPETVERLDALMEAPQVPVAEAASIARFGLSGAPAKATKQRALATFAKHERLRVRHAACRHLGSALYKGDRGVFKVLVDMAGDAEGELLLRSCAALGAGHVATRRHLKTLLGLLEIPEIQQAVIVALQRGLATPKAIDGYVRWFERHATEPDKLHWTSMHVFLPWDAELERMPRGRTINVLRRIAGHTGHLAKVRTVAIEGLGRLKADAALEKLKSQLAADDASEVLQALGR